MVDLGSCKCPACDGSNFNSLRYNDGFEHGLKGQPWISGQYFDWNVGYNDGRTVRAALDRANELSSQGRLHMSTADWQDEDCETLDSLAFKFASKEDDPGGMYNRIYTALAETYPEMDTTPILESKLHSMLEGIHE